VGVRVRIRRLRIYLCPSGSTRAVRSTRLQASARASCVQEREGGQVNPSWLFCLLSASAFSAFLPSSLPPSGSAFSRLCLLSASAFSAFLPSSLLPSRLCLLSALPSSLFCLLSALPSRLFCLLGFCLPGSVFLASAFPALPSWLLPSLGSAFSWLCLLDFCLPGSALSS
jgi:hypothetical protein